ncbi:Homeobox-leucine zipper protein roc3, partial [Thalictrum thalictroides]
FFQDFPHPDEAQRLMISRNVGIAPRQVKFWFQNRRTQVKHLQGRTENETLREENEWLRNQNTTMMDTLRTLMCPLCGPVVATDEQHRLYHENAMLKHERTQLATIIAMSMEEANQELRLGLFIPPPPAGLFVPPPPPADLLIPPPPADSPGTSASGGRVINVSPISEHAPTSSRSSSETRK